MGTRQLGAIEVGTAHHRSRTAGRICSLGNPFFPPGFRIRRPQKRNKKDRPDLSPCGSLGRYVMHYHHPPFMGLHLCLCAAEWHLLLVCENIKVSGLGYFNIYDIVCINSASHLITTKVLCITSLKTNMNSASRGFRPPFVHAWKSCIYVVSLRLCVCFVWVCMLCVCAAAKCD